MIVASRKTVGKRLLPLLLAMVFLLLSLPESAFAASVSAVVTADVMAVYADPGLSRQVGTLEGGEVVAVDRTSGGVAYFRYSRYRWLWLCAHGGYAAAQRCGRAGPRAGFRRALLP